MRARAARVRVRRYERVRHAQKRPHRYASAAEGHGHGFTVPDADHDADLQSPQAANRVAEPSAAHPGSVRSKPKTLQTEIRAFIEQS